VPRTGVEPILLICCPVMNYRKDTKKGYDMGDLNGAQLWVWIYWSTGLSASFVSISGQYIKTPAEEELEAGLS